MKLRVSKSVLIAVAVVCALAVWMASGMVGGRKGPDTEAPASQPAPETSLTSVQVTRMQAQDVTRFVELQGQAEADRTVKVRAETTGRIVELPGERGKRVSKGDKLAVLAMNDRKERLAEAEALVAQRESEYEAAKRLGEQGYQAGNRVKAAKAGLAAARAKLASIREEIEDTSIAAPFGGVLETRPVEIGDYVSVGSLVATVVDDDPLLIVAHVPQQKVNRIKPGAVAEIRFITGQTAEGSVSLVSSVAAEGTRTFRVEVKVANAKREFSAGMSAVARIQTDVVQAHFVSPAIFSLDTEGRLGVKTVGDQNKVAFHPVDVVRAENDGVWVAGLPASARVITVGQGFVRAGETVEPVPDTDASGDDRPAAGARTPESDVVSTRSAG